VFKSLEFWRTTSNDTVETRSYGKKKFVMVKFPEFFSRPSYRYAEYPESLVFDRANLVKSVRFHFIREVLDSNIGRKTILIELVLCLSSSRKMLRKYLEIDHDHALATHFKVRRKLASVHNT
jgi:hypothetical protein